MHKLIFIPALTVVAAVSIFFACQKTQNETTVQPNIGSEQQQTASRGECLPDPSCVLSISQWCPSPGAWDLTVAVETGNCEETEIACYRGDGLNLACQNIGSTAGTFEVIPGATYLFYYTGPVPRTFSIFNDCYLSTVTIRQASLSPQRIPSTAFNCSETGACNW